MYAPSVNTAAPAAKPSKPSVKLTALVAAVTRNQTSRMNKTVGKTIFVSLTNDKAVDPGVLPNSSG